MRSPLERSPAIFLDRDGVLIENRPAYVRCWTDVEIFPQAVRALQLLAGQPYPVILVSNQSAVGRGLLSQAEAEALNQRVMAYFRQAGGRLDRAYLCLHAPQAQCACRKPQPGLLLQAAQDLAIDLPRSILIGDALSDLAAGRAAGLQHLVLLRTGRGEQQLALPEAQGFQPFAVYDDLLGFVEEGVRRGFARG